MQTRQELILDFMKAMAASSTTADAAANWVTQTQEQYAQEVYLMAAILADQYLNRI